MPLSHPFAEGEGPDWAHGWGEDESGAYAELGVGEGSLRLRWIRPVHEEGIGTPGQRVSQGSTGRVAPWRRRLSDGGSTPDGSLLRPAERPLCQNAAPR
jgi:hypothetical protein